MKGNKKILVVAVLLLLIAVSYSTYAIYKSTASAFVIFKQLDKVGAINRMPGCPRAYTINIEGFCQ